MNNLKISLLIVLFALIGKISFAQQKTIFPLKFSENKRYLVDYKNEPFLIKEFSAWGFLQAISEKTEIAIMDSLKKKGFNTLLVSIVSNASSQMSGNPPNWQGVSPFKIKWDFSTPNEKYFKHVDKILKIAEQKGFFVLLVPCYLGYFTDAGQGWWDEMRGPNNSPEKMKVYGEFLGKRYKSTNNIMWVAGGDNDAKGLDEPYMKNLIAGIKLHDKTHLWTGHFDNGSLNFWSTNNSLYKDIIDIDGQYVWQELSMGNRGPQYVSELNQYKNGKMIFQLDQSYEHDVPHYADNENPQWIRRKMYDGLLSGCAGTSFSSGTLDNQAYWFKNTLALMNTPSLKDVYRCFKLFDVLPWQNFIPDTTKNIIVEGRGIFGSLEYMVAAKTSDSSVYMAYIPKGHSFWISPKAISMNRKILYWYNPRNGRLIKIGGQGADEIFGLTAPDENDWIFISTSDSTLKLPNSFK